MTDPPPSPPADEPLVPLEPAQPDPAADWPGFPQASDTPTPWAAEADWPGRRAASGRGAAHACPEPAPGVDRRRGRAVQVLALLLWAYFVW
ncbi:MAG: hypothetical protein U0871_17275 [Gemmataceae bacterium]